MAIYILLGLFLCVGVVAAIEYRKAKADPDSASGLGSLVLWLMKK